MLEAAAVELVGEKGFAGFTPAKAISGDDQRAHLLVLAVAACAHGHAVFVLEGVLDDHRNPLRQALAAAHAAL